MHRILAILMAACFVGQPTIVLSEEPAADNGAKTIDHWLGVAEEMAKRQTIATLDAPVEEFKLREKAVFRHTQSVRGDDIGALFVWTADSGRPAAIGVFFSWSQGRDRWVMEEFHSLCQRPIHKKVAGRENWKCPVPGLQWHVATDMAEPNDDPRRLKLQAKQFPRRLRVKTETQDDQHWELRLVPTPYYEYADEKAGIEYGAIYGLCQGTDTELLVLVEARQNDEKRQWYYALAPFSDYRIIVDLPDGSTWQSPDGRFGENGKPHFWNSIEKRAKPDFEQ